MEVYEIPPELAAKYIPPNRLGQGCGPWVQVLGQDPVVGQDAYFKFRGYQSAWARRETSAKLAVSKMGVIFLAIGGDVESRIVFFGRHALGG